MRVTIERIRTLVLASGALLVIALVAFLAIGRWKSHLNLREIPKRLGVNIQQEANGVTYTQSHGGHTLFKIHASKVVQLKKGNRALLHDVQIELYGEDGTRVDRIAGEEFEYDQKNGTATAAGPVEITLMRPRQAPAVAPQRSAAPGSAADSGPGSRATPLTNAEEKAAEGEVHVKTSGLTFDQKSGLATTAQRVEFGIAQGTGSSVGAIFDSDKGQLVLDHAVELNVTHGTERVLLHAGHAEFQRDSLVCLLQQAQASFRGGTAAAGHARVLFRADGSAARLDATDGFSMTSATDAHVSAPRGSLEFDEHNQPRHGTLAGGATIDSSANERQVHGTAPNADFAFTPQGVLRNAHLEGGVTIHSDETRDAAGKVGQELRVSRDWRSPRADMEFRQAAKGQISLASVAGDGGVVISGESRRGKDAALPSRMAADRVTAEFGESQELSHVTGTGHASLVETTASGATQTTTGDRVEAEFLPRAAAREHPAATGAGGKSPARASAGGTSGSQIESASVDGNVVLVQQPATKAGLAPEGPLRATAGHMHYEGAGAWLHLTLKPRVEDRGLQLTADKVDVSQASGDAFAHGDVKATWLGSPQDKARTGPTAGGTDGLSLGGRGPSHIVASEAQLHQDTGEATFHGRVRLWQDANSISAPVILLNRTRQTLRAESSDPKEPVRVVMLSAGGSLKVSGGEKEAGGGPGTAGTGKASREAHGLPAGLLPASGNKPERAGPSLIRVRGGDLKYSEAERRAIMHGLSGIL